MSVPQRGVRGTQNYSSHSFAVALRQWEPIPDSSLTPAQGSAPPSLCSSPENRRDLTSVSTGATEHPPSLPAGLTFFPQLGVCSAVNWVQASALLTLNSLRWAFGLGWTCSCPKGLGKSGLPWCLKAAPHGQDWGMAGGGVSD